MVCCLGLTSRVVWYQDDLTMYFVYIPEVPVPLCTRSAISGTVVRRMRLLELLRHLQY